MLPHGDNRCSVALSVSKTKRDREGSRFFYKVEKGKEQREEKTIKNNSREAGSSFSLERNRGRREIVG